MSDSGIFGLEFEKKYCHVWNQHPQICLIAKYHQIMKMTKFGTKSTLFGYFWARIFKNYYHIWNQHLQISVTVLFCEKTKMPKFGTKNALFEYFWSKMSYLGIFGLGFKRKLMLYLKSAPSNLPNCKISWNNENP